MRDGNGNYQKVFPLFETGTGTTKKFSRYLGWEQEYQKDFLLVGTGTGNPNKSSRCLGAGFQGVPIGKYMGMGIPTHAWCVVSRMHYTTYSGVFTIKYGALYTLQCNVF